MSTDKCYHFLLCEFTHAIQQSFKLSMWPNHRIEDILAKRHINASKKLHLVRILNKFQNQCTRPAFILLKHCNEQVILPEHIKCSKSGIQKIWKWPEIFSVKVACVFPTKDIKVWKTWWNISATFCLIPCDQWKSPAFPTSYKTSATNITFLCTVTKIQNCRRV
jgi:hypothetical protein